MDLRNSRFAHAKLGSHFFHGQFLEIVEHQDLAFLLRQFRNGARQLLLHFSTQTHKQRGVLRIVWNGVAEVFFLTVEVRLDSKAPHLEAVNFTQ